MFGTYEEAVSWIESRLKFGMKPGLERMQWFMEQMNHPERRVKTVHVAGTNGKGSTVTYLRNILQQAGFKVGTFTSPYIEQFNERISVNGAPVADADLVRLVNHIRPLTEELEKTEFGPPTEFEVITAMSLYYFADIHPVDIVIYEVGLGGRFDSTNVITPLASLITNIGHDHMNVLGNTIAEIAYEKAGIIKPGVPVATTAVLPEALKVIEEKAEKEGASLFRAGQDFSFAYTGGDASGEHFNFTSPYGSYKHLSISMKGRHQVYNASLAVMGAELLKHAHQFAIGQCDLEKGLMESKWIGRFEQLLSDPIVIVDGAHNPEGIDSLIETMETHLRGKKIRIIFSALGDKDLEHMIPKLDHKADQILFTTFDFPRAIPAKALYNISHHRNKTCMEDWKEAISGTMAEICGTDEALVITGSLYFISQVRKYILEYYA
ncbi:bifunctional folylpolyglutamate synthase/dihydrofolate synthase [Weizmannia acidilactici]|uniref:bifunctional folylpolyglutamate synthase/dihydrofolate synthase n=1 Tax=Weizmannia acidilactici TaxID=2607726 RepID=UPI00124D5354|nr:folylpolyglutamate synthase/dihydrofolate synthase family protein [Weizmannia acidilactici]GER66173.1 bifunctional folylpolyglutamate synthase/dihydrofolate synthase [Weizmannia acidilactici]GER72113.1 bifunctional folylpolyglutamate synthase/dihydrofolate synthase [Weizmannia acidilactici]